MFLCHFFSPICHHGLHFQVPLSFPIPHFSTLAHFFLLCPKSLLLFTGCRRRLIASHFTECSLAGHKILPIYLLSEPQQLRRVCCFIYTQSLVLHSTAINIPILFIFSVSLPPLLLDSNQWVSGNI